MSINPDQPAFANAGSTDSGGDYPIYIAPESGLSKLEYFAARAMQGMLSRTPSDLSALLAIKAVEQAEALIAALDAREQRLRSERDLERETRQAAFIAKEEALLDAMIQERVKLRKNTNPTLGESNRLAVLEDDIPWKRGWIAAGCPED